MLLVAGLLAGCGGTASRPAPPTVPAPDAECRIGAEDAPPPGPAPRLAAAAGPADTALLSPARARTPVGIGCTGRPVPRAASAWQADSTRRNWTLVVPSAADLAAAWRGPGAAAALRLAGVAEVVPLDGHRLVVGFGQPQDAVPAVFADPALAAPAGTGDPAPFRVLPPTGDLRDAVDGNADLVVAGDPTVLEYGVARGYARYPLPWNRVYVLLLTGRAPGALSLPDSAGLREDLARNAVQATARAAAPPFWWEVAGGCGRVPAPRGPDRGPIVYPADDPVARALAERIVALARPSDVARGVPAAELPRAMAQGAGGGYIVALPLTPTVPCRELARWPAGAAVVPLIETRPAVLLRGGTPPLAVDHDGGLLPASR